MKSSPKISALKHQASFALGTSRPAERRDATKESRIHVVYIDVNHHSSIGMIICSIMLDQAWLICFEVCACDDNVEVAWKYSWLAAEILVRLGTEIPE